jgi:phosphopentomutase
MRRAVLVVLDGLGIGALDDVVHTRPQDAGADSLAHALQAHDAELPFLAALGLGRAAPSAGLPFAGPPVASWGRAELGYPGADSFLGHQVMMGGDVSTIRLEPFAERLGTYRDELLRGGHAARPLDGLPVLVVDDAMLIADSLEADAGMNYNVTGSLDRTGFDAIRSVAAIVREAAPVPRVVAVGAHDTPLERILADVHEHDGAVGIDTPGLGIYERGAEIEHLGVRDIGAPRQLPSLAAAAGLPVALIGKMADIVVCDDARRMPAVETERVLAMLAETVGHQDRGLIAANVQELDLAGHDGDPEAYVSVLQQADSALVDLAARLGNDDLLIVTGDHGNDPTRGPTHTREAVPVLAFHGDWEPRAIGTRETLADIGATLADWLELPETGTGASFRELMR